jgi:hypothetical protein
MKNEPDTNRLTSALIGGNMNAHIAQRALVGAQPSARSSPPPAAASSVERSGWLPEPNLPVDEFKQLARQLAGSTLNTQPGASAEAAGQAGASTEAVGQAGASTEAVGQAGASTEAAGQQGSTAGGIVPGNQGGQPPVAVSPFAGQLKRSQRLNLRLSEPFPANNSHISKSLVPDFALMLKHSLTATGSNQQPFSPARSASTFAQVGTGPEVFAYPRVVLIFPVSALSIHLSDFLAGAGHWAAECAGGA